MDELTARIREARRDRQALDRLIADYLPFIKSEVARAGPALDYDDRLSLGMLVFMNCVLQYEEGRGGLLSYASRCIRNRLIDETRRQNTRAGALSLTPDEEAETTATVEAVASRQEYDRERERRALAEEIELLSRRLAPLGVRFADLPALSPKQKRARSQCAALAREVMGDEELRKGFLASGRLPQARLAQRFSLSEKTVEKHRRYIVTLCVILTGEFPGIGAWLPDDMRKEVEG